MSVGGIVFGFAISLAVYGLTRMKEEARLKRLPMIWFYLAACECGPILLMLAAWMTFLARNGGL